MTISRAVLLILFAIPAGTLSCGAERSLYGSADGTEDDDAGAPAAPADGGGDAALDARRPPAPARASTCSVKVTGAWKASWTNAGPTGSIATYANYYGDPNAASLEGGNEVFVYCPFAQGDLSYFLMLRVPGVSAAGTYMGGGIELDRTCGGSSCGLSDGWGGSTPCTVTFDTFAPADRGGMSGRYACTPVPSSNAPGPGKLPTIAISGSFDLAPFVAAESPDADAGPPYSSGEPTSCTMHVSGGSGTYDATPGGDGWVYDDGPISCEGTVDGIYYGLDFLEWADGGSGDASAFWWGPPAKLTVEGAAFCTPDCDVDYVSQRACAIDVLVDEGVGGRFKADFDCEDLAIVGVPPGGPGDVLRVTGSIDGIRKSPPPPR